MNILKSKCNRTLSSDKGKMRVQISGLTKLHKSQYYTLGPSINDVMQEGGRGGSLFHDQA